MTDDPDVQAGGDIRPSSAALPGAAELLLGASPNLAEIAGLILGATVPGFADGIGVFVLEQLLGGAEPPGRPPGDPTADRLLARRLGTRIASAGPQGSEAVFPAGDVIAFDPESPYARCVHAGTPVIFGRPDDHSLEQVPMGGRTVLAGYNSFLAVPMTADDEPVGFLALARARGTRGFCESDAEAVGRLAAQAGEGMANALTLMRERSIASALQRGLLAAKPPVPSLLEIAGRCVPTSGHLIGGDWYDVIPLPGDRTGLVVGDVMGHGPEAAAVMAQLRAAAHALADLDLAPADLLWRLNRWSGTLDRITLATCAYAVIDPSGQSCVLAGAGHLPPVLAMPDGTTRVADLPAGQSLGLGPASYGEAHIKLPAGAILALYTDGLVETRTRSFEDGILALRSLLAAEHGPLESLADALISSLAGRYEDDVTVVLARIPAGHGD
ncbi:MAG: PP2C family protein-serine/threonine phosphatase [Streptosporangiaceae bacterium]